MIYIYIYVYVCVCACVCVCVCVKTAGYTWTDYHRNTEVAKELNATPELAQFCNS